MAEDEIDSVAQALAQFFDINSSMKIIIITQDDPFYLGKNIDYLISKLPAYATVVGCIVTKVSPFGRRESLIGNVVRTLSTFGLRFFLWYGVKLVRARIFRETSVPRALRRHEVPMLILNGSINSLGSLDLIQGYRPDLLISIAANEIFQKPLIELAPHGCLNLHTALLPKYRGLMPTFWVLRNGESKTGVSVFFVDEGIDSGPILVQKEIDIDNRTQEELIRDTKRLGMDCIVEAVDKIHRGELSVIDNDDKMKTYFGFPTKLDVREFLRTGARFF